jgi:hypothetical protein
MSAATVTDAARPHRRRVLAAAAIVAVLAGGAVVAALVATRGGDGGNARAARTAPAGTETATVARGTLVARDTVDGTLGYSDSGSVSAGAGGLVTDPPREGTVVREGHSLLEVDGRRTAYLLVGARPAWRALGPATTDGEDVRQLERALRRLGADPDHAMTVDDHWSANTTAAVKRFQHARDLPEDGVLAPGEIVFWPTTARVGEVKAQRGQQLHPGAPLATLSSTHRIVRVDLDADRQALAHTGDAVTVEMPDGSTVRGVVASVGKVATAPAEEGGSATIEVEVRLRGRRARGVGLDQAPVQVGFERERARRVLHVPVTALLARPGGGYAVQVAGAGGALRTVAVELGLEASGQVAVSGAGLRAGQRVVVAQ